MDGLDWITEVPPRITVGLKFTIPTNSSLCNYTLKVINITDTECTIEWVNEYRDRTSIVTDLNFAHQMVAERGWVLI